jgi:hypothetical protein
LGFLVLFPGVERDGQKVATYVWTGTVKEFSDIVNKQGTNILADAVVAYGKDKEATVRYQYRDEKDSEKVMKVGDMKQALSLQKLEKVDPKATVSITFTWSSYKPTSPVVTSALIKPQEGKRLDVPR